MCGRLVCDIKISAKELIRCRSYDLAALCESVSKNILFQRFLYTYTFEHVYCFIMELLESQTYALHPSGVKT